MPSTTRTFVRRLTSAPLALVLCEIRFAPVLTMESHVPAIQDRFRQSGFPGFEQAIEHQFELGSFAAPKLTTQTRWVFKRADSSAAVFLSTSSFSLHVTEYTQFEDFIAALSAIVETIREIVAPAYHERIGIRYVNAVENAGTRMDELFRETVLSFTADELGVVSLLSSQQVVGKTSHGQIVVRMTQVEDAPLLPPDLLSPTFANLARPRNGVHAILDIDGSDLLGGEFEAASIEERLWDIHKYTERAFWKSTTEDAHKEWGITVSKDDASE